MHPMQEVLLSASFRYHDLLLGSAAADMARLVAGDPLALQIEVRMGRMSYMEIMFGKPAV